MAKLDKITSSCSGYFRTGSEDSFPWDAMSGSGVWYSLMVVEDGKIERYGFTAGKGSKKILCEALKEIDPNDDAVLTGVWTGQYNTHLFILDIEIAIKKLEDLTR